VSEHISTARVKRAFSTAADSYDAHAVLQREVADRLLQHLSFTKINPAHILDIGCGTGYFTRLLRQRFRKAAVHALDISTAMLMATRGKQPHRLPWHGKNHYVTADACRLPFADGCFDLVCSNLTMQWTADPWRMMQEMRRVLAPGGLMLFSTFGRRTLTELRQSLAEIAHDRAGLVLPFPDVTALGDMLMTLPVELPVTDADLFTLTYPDTMSLVRELKGLGASSTAILNRPGGLYGRSLLRALESTYGTRHRTEDGRIRATFEALYAQAWHAEPGYGDHHNVIPIRPAGSLPPDA